MEGNDLSNSFLITSSAEPICTIALGDFCEVHGPTIIFSTQVFPLISLRMGKEPPPQTPHKGMCTMCESIPENMGFITTDKETETAFVSKRTPSVLRDEIRQACTRSLSCEWVPREVSGSITSGFVRGRSASVTESEKIPSRAMSPEFSQRSEAKTKPPIVPMIHGNEKNGYTLSLEFKVEDNMARGSTRWYVVNITWMGNPGYLAAVACSRIAERVIEPFIQSIQYRATMFNIRDIEYGRNIFFRRIEIGDDDCSFMTTKRSLAKLVDMEPYKLFEWAHKTFCNVYISLKKELFFPGMSRSPQFVLTSGDSLPIDPDEDVNSFDLIKLFSKLNDTEANILLYNCFAGNQVIVRGAHEDAVRSAVRSIACTLLPRDLRGDICEYSCTYKSLCEARFLGVPLSAQIPQVEEVHMAFDVLEEELFDLFELRDEDISIRNKYAGRAVLTLASGLSKCSVDGTYFQSSIVDDMIASLKSKVTKSRIALVHDRLMTTAKLGYALQSQGFFDNELDASAALSLLKIQKNDIDILKYWMCRIKKNFLGTRPNVDVK